MNVISSTLKRFSVPDVDIDYTKPVKPVFKLTSNPKRISEFVREVVYTIEQSITFGEFKAIDIKFVLVVQFFLKHKEIPSDKDLMAAIDEIFREYTDTIYPELKKTHFKAVSFDLSKAKESSFANFKETVQKALN